MFKKAAADMLGLSDIGSVIEPKDYDKVDSDDYVLHEDNEKIYFLIKSKTDEYCFTDRALIHLDGTSAVSKKRMLKRFDYKHHIISNVLLETAGTVDLDIEIKFTMGGHSYSIDVSKKQLEQLKDLYKALVKISSIQHENAQLHEYAKQSIATTATAIKYSGDTSPLAEQFKAINEYSFEWFKKMHTNHSQSDFSAVFEKYINN